MTRITATKPPKLAHKNGYIVAIGYALVAVLVTLGLLFKFDELLEYAAERTTFGGMVGVVVLTITVITGVLALPYLLRMSVSPLMRVVSALCAVLLPGWWILTGWWLTLSEGGLLGFASLMGAHVALLLALASVWVIGAPGQHKNVEK